MGYWPTSGGHAAVLGTLYSTAPALVVDVTYPENGDVVTIENPEVTWDISSGTQETRQVSIWRYDGNVLTQVLDSTALATSTQSYTPFFALETGHTYLLRVTVLNDEGLIGVGETVFSTVFQPSVAVTGVRLVTFGDKCHSNRYPELPAIRVHWDQIVPGVGESFQSYNVLRREAGETTWEVIRTVTDITTVRIDDFNVRSYTSYEYAVTWTALDGPDVLVSLPQDSVPVARVEYDWTFLHDSLDPTNWVLFYSLEGNEERESDRTFQRLWGRQQPTLFVGEDDHVVIKLKGLPDVFNGEVWNATEGLFGRQREAGSAIVVRRGIARRINFCGFSKLSRALGFKQYEPEIELVETFFDESAAVTA